ncbi:hypothetical protein [Ekhidna sp.]|uniref:hypothetical protein n=1 Tax=Ekhidna sp. TaxID=2608089 RepID=UPI003B512349
MFENLNIGGSLEEDDFEDWLVQGRSSKIRYHYMVILWDETHQDFRPVYLSERSELEKYTDRVNVGDVFIAGYDLYTESKIM